MINSEYLMVHIMIRRLELTSAKPGISCLSSNGLGLRLSGSICVEHIGHNNLSLIRLFVSCLVVTSLKTESCWPRNPVNRDPNMQNYLQFTNKRLGQMCTTIIVQCSNGSGSWRKL